MPNVLEHVERFTQFRDKNIETKVEREGERIRTPGKTKFSREKVILLNCKWCLSSHNHIKTKIDITKITI